MNKLAEKELEWRDRKCVKEREWTLLATCPNARFAAMSHVQEQSFALIEGCGNLIKAETTR